jgi:hypothetical protein
MKMKIMSIYEDFEGSWIARKAIISLPLGLVFTGF